MTNQKSTKRALVLSLLALFVCMSMLIGTTFAWFTDNVTSGRNTIQSGNLDVELYYTTDPAVAADVDSTSWEKVTVNTDIYGYNLWEPGFTKVAYFKIVNNGSLALKYQLTADVYDEVAGKNVAGERFLLSDYIYTAVVDTTATRDSIFASNGTNLKNSIAMASAELLESEDSAVVGLAIWMPTTVGNEANHNGTDIPSIGFGINLVAAQAMYESDSFGNDYDKLATVDTEEELFEALAGDFDVIRLGADIELSDITTFATNQPTAAITIPADKTVTIDLVGHTLSMKKVQASAYALIENEGKLTIKDSIGTGKVSYEDITAYTEDPGWASNTIRNEGVLNIVGGTVENITSEAVMSMGYPHAIDAYQGSVTNVSGGTVKSLNYDSIRMFCNSETLATTVNITGGTIINRVSFQDPAASRAGYGVLNISGGEFITTEGVTANVRLLNFSNVSSNMKATITGGTFDKGFKTQDIVNAGVQLRDWLSTSNVSIPVAGADELLEALENGDNVVLTDDIEIDNNLMLNGGTFDGDGNTLDAYDAISGSDCAVGTTGGTVQNITIVGDKYDTRAIGSGSTGTYILTEDLYINNVYIDKVQYAINGGGNGTAKVVVTDSTLYGWISYANISSFEFTNCTLGIGNSYDGYMVVYGNTSFTDCTFETFDMCADDAVVPGSVITFTNCYNDGQKVTVDNFKTLFMYPGDDVDFGKLSACTIIIDGETLVW